MLTEYQLSNKRLRKALKRGRCGKLIGFNTNASLSGKYRDAWEALPKLEYLLHMPKNTVNVFSKVTTFFRCKTI